MHLMGSHLSSGYSQGLMVIFPMTKYCYGYWYEYDAIVRIKTGVWLKLAILPCNYCEATQQHRYLGALHILPCYVGECDYSPLHYR